MPILAHILPILSQPLALDGEKIWHGYPSTGTIGESMAKSVQLYYSELLTPGMADLVTNIVTFPADKGAGHYTQVVSGNTYEIGKKCPDGYWHLVRQYNAVSPPFLASTGPGGCTTDADCTTQAADTCSTSDGLCNRV
uniref:Uncharacterized protein n=1 Tax=Panagrolaimus davidi TaxID=227884 RepID=A0A914Q642_9BILA